MKYIFILFLLLISLPKLLAQKTIIEKMKIAYPDFVEGISNNKVIFKDGRQLIFDDGLKKSPTELLDNADIEDQFHYQYFKGKGLGKIIKWQDAGRIRNEEFFKTMYGHTEEDVKKNLVEIVWCPKNIGQKILVTKINGIDKAILKISAELDEYPEFKKYLSDIGGTFTWRKISGTNRLSTHSFGMTMDINVKQSHYWQWDCKCMNEEQNLKYKNSIPLKIVEIFEKHGFIWGGKWYHYDTMHFEYRPELLLD